MMRAETRAPVRRILVPLDASPASVMALDAIAELAARSEAELHGLFVEDINLLRLAGLPFACETSFLFATTRRIEATAMERALRAQAAQAEAALDRAARVHSLRSSFRVVRGLVLQELITASADADLLVFGWPSSRAEPVQRGFGPHELAAGAGRSVLFLLHGAAPNPPVALVYDQTRCARQAVASAARLSRDERHGVTVILPAPVAETARELIDQATELLHRDGASVESVRRLAANNAEALLAAARAAHCGTLVLPADLPWLNRECVERLLAKADIAVLLAR